VPSRPSAAELSLPRGTKTDQSFVRVGISARPNVVAIQRASKPLVEMPATIRFMSEKDMLPGYYFGPEEAIYSPGAVALLDTPLFAGMLSRSVFGVVPDTASMGKQPRGPALNFYEETISTVENPPQTATRFFEPQFEQERQGDPAQSPPGRAQAVDAGLGQPGLPMGTSTPGRFRFRRASHIKQGRDFARARQQGERVALGCLIAIWRRLAPNAHSRFGVITSRRIGGAVVRSRARRLLRESFRLNQDQLARPVDLVLVARASIAGKSFSEVEKDFLTSLRKAGLLKGLSGT
jgi:ribonuclease P protein component